MPTELVERSESATVPKEVDGLAGNWSDIAFVRGPSAPHNFYFTFLARLPPGCIKLSGPWSVVHVHRESVQSGTCLQAQKDLAHLRQFIAHGFAPSLSHSHIKPLALSQSHTLTPHNPVRSCFFSRSS